jgi:chorismate mutase
MSDDKLKNLRDELDTIDIKIQALLNRRAEVSLDVRKVKTDGQSKLMPGREAQILRTLIQRHQGPFPKLELIRIWREILSASLQAQGPFSIAVYNPEDGKNNHGYITSARQHFGAYTAMVCYSSQRRVVESILEGECTIGILPMPERNEENPWWQHLAFQGKGVTNKPAQIIAKLPFAETPIVRGAPADQAFECLVIAKSKPDQSGLDGTYIALDLKENISSARIDSRLSENDIMGSVVAVWHDTEAPERWLSLLNINELISSRNAKLDHLASDLRGSLNQVTILGYYALPLSIEVLISDNHNEKN